MIEGLAACFAGLADPRATRRCDHRLIDILVIAVETVQNLGGLTLPLGTND